MNVFAKKPTAKEALRESKREMTNATRGIEREITTLQLEEKKLVAEIKRTAKTGNEAATKILARQLIRLRQQIAKLQGSRAQMRGIATHTQAMSAQSSVAVGMQGASKAMASMTKQMSPAKQAKVIQEFQKQSAQMDMTTEMMSDVIDDALDNDEAEEETEELTNQVHFLNFCCSFIYQQHPKEELLGRRPRMLTVLALMRWRRGWQPLEILELKIQGQTMFHGLIDNWILLLICEFVEGCTLHIVFPSSVFAFSFLQNHDIKWN
ncbi:hypothetical protein ACSBR2_032158 [Camellia fascicularis]